MNTLCVSMSNRAAYLYLVLAIIFGFSFPQSGQAQCTLTASATDTVVCGDCVALSAFGQGQGQSVFFEDFNSGTPSGWAYTQQATFTNPCSPGGVDGTTHIWMGNQSGVPRVLRTVAYDFTPATAGVTICFDMLFAEQGNASPCEGPDLPTEGVYLQYSIDGGNTWVTIHYFDPNGGYDPDLINWHNWCFQLPPGAITSSTQIRWFQDNDSGADYDHWGIDNVNIFFNDPTYEIVWQHDGYSYGVGSSGGVDPYLVCPHATTTYTVNMSNGSSSCSASVTINVISPTIEVDAGTDTTICSGDCADLFATAKVVKRPAKTPTYDNSEFQPIAAAFGQSTDIDINVTGLNMTNILPGSISSVCIDGLTFYGQNIFPPGTQDIGDLTITLICPDGTSILLVPDQVTSGTPTTGYQNTCFTPVATNTLAGSSTPYTGDFVPNEPLDNLVGCTANGVWTMQINSTAILGIGIGTFWGWSITFDDPEISYPADFSWSPTTNMTGSGTLTPTVCPTVTTTYTLTASDTAGCVTVTDQVTVTVDQVCCQVYIDSVQTVDPNCGASNGSITIFPNQNLGASTYSVDGGASYQPGTQFTGLPAGTYTVILQHPTCSDTTTVTLTNQGNVSITNLAPTDPTCGATDGSIVVTATGATQYSIDNGSTWQASGTFNNLGPGSYTIIAQDASGSCQDSITTSLSNLNGPVLNGATPTDPTCGSSNGSIVVNATGIGLQYSVNGGTSYQGGNSFGGLAAGTYNVVVQDNNGCQATTQVVLTAQGVVTIDSIVVTDATCGNNNGTITIYAPAGTQFSIDNGANFQAGNSFTGLPDNTYDIVVTSAIGCQATGTATIANNGGVSIGSVTPTDPTCGQPNGSISINATGATQYSIDNGANFQAGSSFNNLAAGNYSIVAEDAFGCQDTSSVTLTAIAGPAIDSVATVNPSCGVADGQLTVYSTTATQYSIDAGANYQAGNAFSSLNVGNYTIVVQDANGCTDTTNISLSNLNGPAITNFSQVDETCSGSNGSIDITVTGGTGAGTYTFSWNNGTYVTEDISGLSAGTYNVTISDGNNCSTTANYTIGNTAVPALGNATITDENCGSVNGAIDITVSGGSGPYTYLWSNNATTEDIANVAAGNYLVTVTDANGCSVFDTYTVNNIGGPAIDSVATTNPNCGASDGTISIFANGATQYSIDNGASFQAGSTFSNLGSGSYNIVIEDGSGCQAATTVNLGNTAGLVIDTINTTEPGCGQADGSITIVASGGTAPLQYSIDGGTTFQAGGTFTGLVVDNYSVVVEDVNGCQETQLVNLVNSAAPQITNVNATDPRCGDANGVITVVAQGGVDPLRFSYDGGSSYFNNAHFTNLPDGSYEIHVLDNLNCEVVWPDPVVLVNSGRPVVDASVVDDTCGQSVGAISLSVSGGLPDYTFNWAHNSTLTGPVASELTEGSYTVSVVDQNTCQTVEVIAVDCIPETPILYIPNAFSPNGDGRNDLFFVYGDYISHINIRVFDRWGEIVFKTNDATKGWDGTYKGKIMDPAVFVYQISATFTTNIDKVYFYEGSVTLIR